MLPVDANADPVEPEPEKRTPLAVRLDSAVAAAQTAVDDAIDAHDVAVKRAQQQLDIATAARDLVAKNPDLATLLDLMQKGSL